MTNPFREQIWFINGFLKKYRQQILISLGLTVVAAFIGSEIVSKLPKPKTRNRVAIVGQFSSTQIPQYILRRLKAGLIEIGPNLEPQPGLAEKWEIGNDGKTYTFYLNPNLKWYSGQEVKASDIKISIPNIGIETIDPNIIRFQIPTKFSPFLSLLNIPLLNFKGEIVGDSSIKLKQKSSGVISQVSIESANKELIFNVLPTAKQAITTFKLGQADLVLDLPFEYLEDAKSFGKTQVRTDFTRVALLIFNQQDPSLKEKTTRQGIAYSLKDKVFGQTEALTTINPLSWAHNPLVKSYPFNSQKAREMIKSPLTLELATTPDLLNVAENIKNQLAENQISINTKVVTSTPEQFQLYLTYYNIPNDPDQYRDWHSTQATNLGRGSDEKLDKLLEDGRTTQDLKDRKKIYFDFQKTFSEELPALVLYHPSVFNLARKNSHFELLTPN